MGIFGSIHPEIYSTEMYRNEERENEKVFVQRQNFQGIISKSERWGLGPKSETLKLQAEII